MWRSKDLKDSLRKTIEMDNLREHLKTSCCDVAQTTCLSHGTLIILYTWTLGYLVCLHTWLSCILTYLAILHTWLFGYLVYLHTWLFCILAYLAILHTCILGYLAYLIIWLSCILATWLSCILAYLVFLLRWEQLVNVSTDLSMFMVSC